MTPELAKRCGLVFDAANMIDKLGLPYVYAGGRDPVHPFQPSDALPPFPRTGRKGYDCASSISAALKAGGLLLEPEAHAPIDTNAFEVWGDDGIGELITVAVRDRTHPTVLHHCALHFNMARAALHGLRWNLPRVISSGGWFQFTHTGGPTGWVGFDSTGFILRHKLGT